MSESPSYYAILPANVRYDKTLKSMEKIMFAEITALTESNGYCFAQNGYFAGLYDVSNETVSRWVSARKLKANKNRHHGAINTRRFPNNYEVIIS